MSEHRLRCGDTVRLAGEDFDIEVAYADYETGRLSWCGWPNGEVKIERVTLVEACTDDEHKAAVARWCDQARRTDDHDRRRATVARLYRPRAYYRSLLERRRGEASDLWEQCVRLEAELARAEAGPEDV